MTTDDLRPGILPLCPKPSPETQYYMGDIGKRCLGRDTSVVLTWRWGAMGEGDWIRLRDGR